MAVNTDTCVDMFRPDVVLLCISRTCDFMIYLYFLHLLYLIKVTTQKKLRICCIIGIVKSNKKNMNFNILKIII